ncbi:hypothetical protein GCM10009677_57800 [Sphaerisporangium rubeum]
MIWQPAAARALVVIDTAAARPTTRAASTAAVLRMDIADSFHPPLAARGDIGDPRRRRHGTRAGPATGRTATVAIMLGVHPNYSHVATNPLTVRPPGDVRTARLRAGKFHGGSAGTPSLPRGERAVEEQVDDLGRGDLGDVVAGEAAP